MTLKLSDNDLRHARPAVLVTGAARRIGREIALELARHGWDIAAHYRSSEAEASSLATEIEAMGRRCALLRQELNDLAALPRLIAEAQAALPNLAALVNNASTFRRISFADTTPESLEEDLAVNFKAPFFLTQAFARQVEQGAVTHLLDTAVYSQRTTHFAYLLAKKTLREFTAMAARDLAPAVRVNAVAPGFVLPTESAPEYDPAEAARRLPLGRRPTLQEIAQAVRMTLEHEGMTGQILTIDGGEHLL